MKRRAAAINVACVSGQAQVTGADPFLTGMEKKLARRIRQFPDARLK